MQRTAVSDARMPQCPKSDEAAQAMETILLSRIAPALLGSHGAQGQKSINLSSIRPTAASNEGKDSMKRTLLAATAAFLAMGAGQALAEGFYIGASAGVNLLSGSDSD